MGNGSKKGKNMGGIIAWSIFASWFFNPTLSIYVRYLPEVFLLVGFLTHICLYMSAIWKAVIKSEFLFTPEKIFDYCKLNFKI